MVTKPKSTAANPGAIGTFRLRVAGHWSIATALRGCKRLPSRAGSLPPSSRSNNQRHCGGVRSLGRFFFGESTPPLIRGGLLYWETRVLHLVLAAHPPPIHVQ